MIRAELIERERWMEPERFRRVLGIYQVLPGPEAHELCVHLGRVKGGRIGGFLAGLGFMGPGFVLMLGLAVMYERYLEGSLFLLRASAGVAPVVVLLVARGAFRIGKGALHGPWLIAGALAGLAGELLGVPFVATLLGAGLAAALAARGQLLMAALMGGAVFSVGFLFIAEELPSTGGMLILVAAPSLVGLFLLGLRGGLLTFGGAYTAIPFVRALAVGPGGFMTEAAFLDAIALGGLIPAPLVIFVTSSATRAVA